MVYLFGLGAKGAFREESDIDIAFFSDLEMSEYEIFMLAQKLADNLKRDVDLIDFKKASTVFKAQIIGNGEVIFCNDDVRKNNFQLRALKEYAYLNEERIEILDGIKKRGKVYDK